MNKNFENILIEFIKERFGIIAHLSIIDREENGIYFFDYDKRPLLDYDYYKLEFKTFYNCIDKYNNEYTMCVYINNEQNLFKFNIKDLNSEFLLFRRKRKLKIIK